MTGLNHSGETAVYALNTGVGTIISLLPFNWSVVVGPAISLVGGLALALFNYYLRQRQAEADVAYLVYKDREIAELKKRLAEVEK
jgi:hypothetical protein